MKKSVEENVLESFSNVAKDGRKSGLPAKLDFMQSATGLFLALFMIGHMILVSSILLGKDVMYALTKFFELDFIFDGGNPTAVAVVISVVFAVFFIHAALAMRKFPINYKQYKMLKSFKDLYNHPDTNLWFVQAVTGFVMFFAGSAHLIMMFTNPGDIGPYASADRVWSEHMWAVYLVLLIAVEFHGSIGLYRLSVKWGWFDGILTRKQLQTFKKIMSMVLVGLGLLTLAAYAKIGMNHSDSAGERYHPKTEVTRGVK
jgi:fumarate reductase subunit C